MSPQAKSLLEQAKQTFENGDRMRALKLYEDTLKQVRVFTCYLL